MSITALHSPMNISETVRHSVFGPTPKGPPIGYGESNGHVTDDVM